MSHSTQLKHLDQLLSSLSDDDSDTEDEDATLHHHQQQRHDPEEHCNAAAAAADQGSDGISPLELTSSDSIPITQELKSFLSELDQLDDDDDDDDVTAPDTTTTTTTTTTGGGADDDDNISLETRIVVGGSKAMDDAQRHHTARKYKDDRELLNELLKELEANNGSQQQNGNEESLGATLQDREGRTIQQNQQQQQQQQSIGKSRVKCQQIQHNNSSSKRKHVNVLKEARNLIMRDEQTMNIVVDDLQNQWMMSRVGTPQIIKFSERRFVALGTSLGLILLYDLWQQRRVAIIGAVPKGQDHETSMGVTALAFSPFVSGMLLAGYSSGEVVAWSLENFTPMVRIKEQFTSLVHCVDFLGGAQTTHLSQAVSDFLARTTGAGSAVDSIFPIAFVAADATGAVKLFTIRKTVLSFSVDPISVDTIEDNIGTMQISSMSVLPIGEGDHPLNRYSIAAMASTGMTTIFMLLPTVKHLYTFDNVQQSEDTRTYFAWRRSALLDGEYTNLRDIPPCSDPLLAVGCGDTLQIIMVNVDNMNHPIITPVGKVHLPFTVAGLCWFSQQTIGAHSDESGQIAIVDLQTMELVEHINTDRIDTNLTTASGIDNIISSDCAHVYSVIDTSREARESTKSNDEVFQSPLITIHRNDGAHRIVISHSQPTMFATLSSSSKIYAYAVKSWNERIDALTRIGAWRDAFKLAIDLYHGRGTGVVGLATHGVYRKQLVAQVIANLLDRYCDLTLSSNHQQNTQKVYEKVGKMCLDYALQISNVDVFIRLYKKFASQGQEDIFVSLLEPFIIEERLTSLHDRGLFNSFINYYVKHNKFDDLERCVILLKLDKDAVDFDQICALCEKHMSNDSLIRVYLYVHNAIKGEFVEPLKRLVKNASQKRVDIIHQYLHHCIHGRTYSNVHRLTTEQAANIKKQVLQFIFRPTMSGARLVSYPNAEVLLRKSPQNFFRILAAGFGDTSPSSPWEESCEGHDLEIAADQTMLSKYHIIQLLVRMMVNTKTAPFVLDSKNPQWTLDHLIHFYSFLVASIAQNRVPPFDMELVFRAITHLAADIKCDESINQERQEYIISILHANSVEKSSLIQNLIQVCEKSPRKLHKLIIFLYKQLHDYDAVIRCYLCDSTIRNTVFIYLKDIYSEDIHLELRNAIINQLPELMRVDSVATTELIVRFFDTDHQRVVDILFDLDKRAFYDYLKNIIAMNEGESSAGIKEAVSQNLPIIEVDTETLVEYIKLMCQYEPQNVYHHLVKYQALTNTKADIILEYCKEYHIHDAISFLLEHMGEVAVALQFVMQKVEQKVQELKEKLFYWAHKIDPHNDQFSDVKCYGKYEAIASNAEPLLPLIDGKSVLVLSETMSVGEELNAAISLCQRNAARKILDEEDVKQLWFDLMDHFAVPLRQLRHAFANKEPLLAESKQNDLSKIADEREKYVKMLAECQRRLDQFQLRLKEDNLDDSDEEETLLSRKERNQQLIDQLKRKLEALDKQERQLEEDRAKKESDPFAPHNLPKLVNLWLQRAYHCVIHRIIFAMAKSISAPVVLNKLILDNATNEFGEIRSTILQLLSFHNQEHDTMDVMNRILEDDTFALCSRFKNRMNRALYPRSSKCDLCNRSLYRSTSPNNVSTRVFSCGHAFHVTCIGHSCHHCPIDSTATHTNSRQQQRHRMNRWAARNKTAHKSQDDMGSSLSATDRLIEMERRLNAASRPPLFKTLVDGNHGTFAEHVNGGGGGGGKPHLSSLLTLSPAAQWRNTMDNPNTRKRHGDATTTTAAANAADAVNSGSCNIAELLSE